MIDIEPHYQVCLDQEEGKMCICDDIREEAQQADIDGLIDDMLGEKV